MIMFNENLNDKFSFEYSESKSSLDVLLELIKKKKTSIKDIDIKELTNQFIEYFHKHEHSVSLEQYSDYANMSAYLVELKTRSLLPDANLDIKGHKSLQEERDAFIKRLLEHQMYKNAVPLLTKCKEKRSFLLDKFPEDFEEYLPDSIPCTKLPKQMNIKKLSDALENMLIKQVIKQRLESPVDLHIAAQEYSVEEVILDLIETFHKKLTDGSTFSNFFLNHLPDHKQNIDFFCMLVFVIISLVHQGCLFIDELENNDFFLKLNTDLLDSKQETASFISKIKQDLFGEE